MNVLSIQSSVAYGHVGNSAAAFPLQRLGFEVWPVNTVQFSNHTGYGTWRGPVLPASDIAEVLLGIEERGVLPRCDAVLTGYMGDASLGEVVLDTVARVKRTNPNALYCCDPVMGDVDTGFYVRPGIPEFMRARAIPMADIITPNQFEAEYLTGRPTGDLDGAIEAAEELRRLGPRIVLVTSLRRADAPEGRVEMMAVSAEGTWLVATPLLPFYISGGGDLTAALFLGNCLRGEGVAAALGATAAAVFAVIRETHRAGSEELVLVAAQEALVAPPERFPVERVR